MHENSIKHNDLVKDSKIFPNGLVLRHLKDDERTYEIYNWQSFNIFAYMLSNTLEYKQGEIKTCFYSL